MVYNHDPNSRKQPHRRGTAKILTRIVCFLLLVLAFTIGAGCHYQDDTGNELYFAEEETVEAVNETKTQKPPEQTSPSAPEWIESSCMAIAESYREMIANAHEIDDAVIQRIETQLVSAGHPTVVREGDYPEYLANSEILYDFWNQVTAGKDGAIGIVRVSESGGFSYLYFRSTRGQGQCCTALLEWNENQMPYLSSYTERPVYDWELTEDGSFFYQIYPPDCHYDDYARMLLQPVNKEYYDLVLSYITPIGYYQNNMFYCNWSEQDFGSLCFNDLFGCLYKMRSGQALDLNEFTCHMEPKYYLIPKNLFEQTVTSFFSITGERLRNLAVYFDTQNEYAYADNYLYYPDDIPDMRPMVTNRTDNPDGTFTIFVTVSSLEKKTDRLFCHEVTIRPLEDGGFQYVSNRISYLTDYGLPPNFPRLPAEIR